MNERHPRLIQGGMGIGVSSWELARAVSMAGQLGTVSLTGIWLVTTRLLQQGDPGGHVRRALSHFPSQAMAERILDLYFVPDGKRDGRPYRTPPMLTLPLRADLTELLIVSSFAEVWLAKEGHDGVIAANSLEKIQMAHLPSLYGAMLAGVDYVLMGAGIPTQIPGVLDRLAEHQPARYRIAVDGAGPGDLYEACFDPGESMPMDRSPDPLRRPFFFPIVSSHVLAQMLVKRSQGEVNGFVIEGPTAGGHNAPPRNRKDLTPSGEPVYGEHDAVDLDKMIALKRPFWLAGSQSGPNSLPDAVAAGAHGIQAGSIFALCGESRLQSALKREVISQHAAGPVEVRTNPAGSPSGYPFKEVSVPGTLSDPEVYDERRRVCDIGCLRTPYRRPDGALGYRCPAEPVDDYLKKGGTLEETRGRRCLCNALTASIGLGQVRPLWGSVEPSLLTLGTDLDFLSRVAREGEYSAVEAVNYLVRVGE